MKVPAWAGVLAFAVGLAALFVIVGGCVFLAYGAGYTKGALSNRDASMLDGATSTCARLKIQAQWATNVENDLVKSKQDSAASAAKVKAAEAAARHYACDWTSKASPNPLEPPTS